MHALAVLREVSPRSRDAVHAVGELVSSRMVAAAFAEHGIPSAWIDARTVLITDDEHNAAAPDMVETCERARAVVAPQIAAGKVVVAGRLHRRHRERRHLDARPRRVGLFGGHLRRVPRTWTRSRSGPTSTAC